MYELIIKENISDTNLYALLGKCLFAFLNLVQNNNLKKSINQFTYLCATFVTFTGTSTAITKFIDFIIFVLV